MLLVKKVQLRADHAKAERLDWIITLSTAHG
jgi:hypothetical protein